MCVNYTAALDKTEQENTRDDEGHNAPRKILRFHA